MRSISKWAFPLLCAALLLCVLPVEAQAVAVTYAVTGGNLTFNSDTGRVTDCEPTVTQAVIPSEFSCEINGETVKVEVVGINNNAFDGSLGDHTNLTRVDIPSSVTYIGSYSFAECTGLTELVIPSAVTEVGPGAFKDCTGLTEMIIPHGVTAISGGLFQNCTGLERVTLSENATSIGANAFRDCASLTGIVIPETVASIGANAFRGCASLASANIPGKVASIEEYTFQGCAGLTEIAIPDSVATIGNSAFNGCAALTSLTLSDSLTSMGNYAFAYCAGLTDVTIPASLTSISDSAFSDCTGLKTVTIPASVETIKNFAFSGTALTDVYYGGTEEQWAAITIGTGNSPLTAATIHYSAGGETTEPADDPLAVTGGSLTFDEATGAITGCESTVTQAVIPSQVNGVQVTAIGPSAFANCDSLTSVTIPDSVEAIGSYAFNNCDSLESIAIPGSVASIGQSAFFSCPALTAITVDDGNPSYCSADGVLFNKDRTRLIAYPAGKAGGYAIPYGVTAIDEEAFYGCQGLTSVTVPHGVTAIGRATFTGCENLESIAIPNSVASIGFGAFKWCYKLGGVTLPDSLTSIEDYAFMDCTSLTQAVIPRGVAGISEGAFYRCTGLNTVIISEGVANIYRDAFSGCTALTNVYYGGTEEQWSDIVIYENNKALTALDVSYGYTGKLEKPEVAVPDSGGQEEVTLTVSAVNTRPVTLVSTLVLGIYDQNGRLLGIETKTVTTPAGEELNADFLIDRAQYAGTVKVRIFWLEVSCSPVSDAWQQEL